MIRILSLICMGSQFRACQKEDLTAVQLYSVYLEIFLFGLTLEKSHIGKKFSPHSSKQFFQPAFKPSVKIALTLKAFPYFFSLDYSTVASMSIISLFFPYLFLYFYPFFFLTHTCSDESTTNLGSQTCVIYILVQLLFTL